MWAFDPFTPQEQIVGIPIEDVIPESETPLVEPNSKFPYPLFLAISLPFQK